MASLAEIQSLVQQIHQDLPALIQRARINPQQVVLIEGIADLSKRLGLIQAGEFRAGNDKEPGFGFTGGRYGYPGFAYNGGVYFLVGVENDILQVGLSLTDGTIKAGGGDVTLDASGIWFANQEGKVAFEDTSGSIETIVMYSDNADFLVLKNAVGGKGITFDIDDAGHVVSQYTFADDNMSLDEEVVIFFGEDGHTTEFNVGRFDIDVAFHDANASDLLFLDAGASTIGIGTNAPGAKLDIVGSLKVDSITNDTGLAHGTYAPTLTGTANIDSTSAVANFTYLRVGNTVIVSGNLNSDATAAGASTVIRCTLPIASNFTSTGDLTGTGGIQGSDDVVIASADTTNDTADFQYTANGTANTVIRIMFMYVVK
jgi:hypothetical protein